MASQIELVAGVDRLLPNVVSLFGTQHFEDELEKEKLAASEAFYDPAQPRDADGKWAGGGGGSFKKLDWRTKLIGDLEVASPSARKLDGVYFRTKESAKINGALRRGEQDEEMHKTIAEIDTLFAEAAIPLPEGIEALRGARLSSETAAMLQPGAYIRDKGFTSVTSDDGRAENFAFNKVWGSGEMAVLATVRIPKGTKVVPHLEEDELMLNRGTAFKVMSAQTEQIFMRGEVLKVTLEVVPE